MRYPRWVLAVGSLLVGIGSLGGFLEPAQAEEGPTDQAAILKRLDELDQEVRILKRKLELSQKDATTKVKNAPIVTASSKDGFSIQSADKNFQLKIRGYDTWFLVDDEPGASTFVLRRVRSIFEGMVAKTLNFASCQTSAAVRPRWWPRTSTRTTGKKPNCVRASSKCH